MLQTLIGPITELAGGWLNAKPTLKQTAKLKLTEAEAKAKILVSKETSVQDWERIMAQGSQNSWKDEWLVLLFSIPLILYSLANKAGQLLQKGLQHWNKCLSGINTR